MSGADTEAGASIQAFVADHRQDAVDALAALVAVPSDNPPGDCNAHAERAAAWLSGLGLTVERHPVPEALVRGNGMITATNLVVRESFGPGPVIALNAHGDVVAPGEGWTADPYGGEIRDGWMMGRGAATSKSDFVTYTHALLALRTCRACRYKAASSSTSPTTKKPVARSAPSGSSRKGSPGPITPYAPDSLMA